MKKHPLLVKTLLSAVILSLVILLFEAKFHAEKPILAFAFIPWFFFGVANGVQYVLSGVLKKNRNRFVPTYLGLSFGKLMFYSLMILAYLFMKGPQPLAFALICLVCYFLFTTLQMLEFLKMTKDSIRG